ncbi:hypothetical protein JW711_01820, partial [Candidatus Woesearchaeota archaeon]|nr:hypothetical protein [Candidatus Woesearchaeota archaeon]
DFERCRFTERPKNVTQFLQYVSKMKRVLRDKGFSVDEASCIKLGSEYKKKLDDKSFEKIMKTFS